MALGKWPVSFLLILFLISSSLATVPQVRIGTLNDGPGELNSTVEAIFKAEIEDLLSGEYQVVWPEDKQLVADWTLEKIAANFESLNSNPEVDIIINLGPISSTYAVYAHSSYKFSKPVLCPFALGFNELDLPVSETGGSGLENLSYLTVPQFFQRDIKMFEEICDFKHLGILIQESFLEIGDKRHCEKIEGLGLDKVSIIPAGTDVEEILNSIPGDIEALYVAPIFSLSDADFRKLMAEINKRKIPSFAIMGEYDVKRGVLAGLNTDQMINRYARRTALNIQRILLGDKPADLKVAIASEQRLSLNMEAARITGISPDWEIETEAIKYNEKRKVVDNILNLDQALHIATKNNLDIITKQHEVKAARENIANARSNLLPSFDASATAAIIDNDRAEASMGQAAERTYSGELTATQLLFNEQVWANYSIQKSLYQGLKEELRTEYLNILQQTAEAYINVLMALSLEDIQKNNLKLTRENLEIARIRELAGMAGPAEVYRWEAELAGIRQDVIKANSQRNLAEIQLNRMLNHPLEESFLLDESKMDTHELIIKLAPSFAFISDRKNFKIVRSFSVEEALANSPELAQLEATITAQERYLASQKRQYYMPTVALQANLERIFERDGAGSEGMDMSGLAANPALAPLADIFGNSADDTNWSIGINVSIPLYNGGSRYASQHKTESELDQLKSLYESSRTKIEQRIRSALHTAGASYASIRLSAEAAEAAAKSLNVVKDAYSNGVVNITDLLDAQNAALVTQEAAAIAVYQFIVDYISVGRAMGHFETLDGEKATQEFLEKLKAYLVANGGTID